MTDLKYRFNDNHHFNKSIYYDTMRLIDRLLVFYDHNLILPSDENLMKFFGWNKDHLNRVFQMLKEIGVVDYSRGHRRTTLVFNGEYEKLNRLVTKRKKVL